MDGDPQIPAIVAALAQYLRLHPFASDTADGILRWWLGSDFATMEELLMALDFLQRRHAVDVVTAADGRLRYRRAGSDRELDELIRGVPH